MTGWLLWLGALAVLSVVLVWGLNRELLRIEQERRMREWLATSPAALRLKVNFEAMSRQIGVALLPAIQRLGQAIHDAQPSLARLAAAMTTAPSTSPDPEPEGSSMEDR